MGAMARARLREGGCEARPRRVPATLVLGTAVAGLAGFLGFVVFANSACRIHTAAGQRADGIVVLTGGADRRIDEGLRLLEQGQGRRLLISGINPRTSPGDLRRAAHWNNAKLDCCIDFGYVAQDTIGNAEEARAWAERNRFGRLLVVTSSYHMQRSMSELSRVLPEATLIPHPIVPRFLRDEPWWLNLSTTRILAVEYVKLLPSLARSWAVRLLRPGESAGAARPSASGSTARLERTPERP